MTSQRNGEPLPVGKLPSDLLAAFLQALPATDPSVLVGARYGEDAAVVKVGEHYLVMALDPVTLSREPGRIAVQVNANDVAVMGAEPRWLLAAIILPPGSTAAGAQAVLEQLRQGCAGLGVVLIGGHTEISPSVTQPVVAACMIGEVAADQLVTSSGARPGDSVLLAGPIAVEGTGILAGEYAPVLRARGVPERLIEEGAALLDDPGISVMPAVRALMASIRPRAMHDLTEGGLLSTLRELATASGAGLRIEAERIPVLPVCQAVCAALDLDPLGLLASGSLLAALAPDHGQAAQEVLADAGIASAVIGRIVPAADGMTLVRAGIEEPLPEVERDELARWVDGMR